MDRSLAVIVLAAGSGTRMKSVLPKVLHKVAGVPMISHVLAAAEALKPAKIVGVVAPWQDAVAAAFAPHATAVQARPRGTGHAVMAALPALGDFAGDVLVMFGDTPLVTPHSLRRLLKARRAAGPARAPGKRGHALAAMGFRSADPRPYGRFVLDGKALVRIVETRDASAAERRIDLCNAGVMAIDGAALPGLLSRLANRNAKREYYLTDLVTIAVGEGRRCTWAEGEEAEFLGINTRAELAAAEAAMQARLRVRAMEAGVTLRDPSTVWLSADTRFGRDVVIGPSVVFGPGVRVGDGVEILGFCYLEGADIGREAIVGPFARMRPTTRLGARAHVGNFVELKNTNLRQGAKANHHAYLGDGDIGPRTNIGAGTIFVNYDGYAKWQTKIGADAFIGSNASLLAPLEIGDRVYVPAGSVISNPVPADAVAFGRARQVDKPGMAPGLRRKLQARAAARSKR
jgi:bifunctional UDP-N-acetylglucosamine pyrophosphorylase/glucosamine-1-phosphate N-acetyltransferase